MAAFTFVSAVAAVDVRRLVDFAACAASVTASGFAIGRSVFWDPSAAFLEARMSAADATAAIAGTYVALIDAWDASRSWK